MSRSVRTATAAPPGLWTPRAMPILEVQSELADVNTYAVQAPPDYRFAAGQFNMLYVPGYGEAAISISSDPHCSGYLEHTVRAVGNVTAALARLQVGDTLWLRGPFGSSWPMESCRGCDLVIACGGLGLAPLRPALHHILHHRGDYGEVHLLYGARSPADLLYPGQYQAWRQAGIDVQVTVDQADGQWTGSVGVVTQLMDRLRLRPEQTRVLTCGPEIMMRFVALGAIRRNVPRQHIYVSMERNMQCAVGLCGHCQLGPAFVCQDGPVFTYQSLEPFMHLEDL